MLLYALCTFVAIERDHARWSWSHTFWVWLVIMVLRIAIFGETGSTTLYAMIIGHWCRMDASGVIKVADFGLSEDIYTSTYYRQEKSDTAVKLPVRWMPPESIADGIFTEKSDVVSVTLTGMQHAGSKTVLQSSMQWSFGITCWEVFTGGHIPYSGISPVALLQLIRNGERLNKPMNPACSDEM